MGLARVHLGRVEEGLSDLDEAMAVATSLDDPVVAADTACSLMQAAELIGDITPFDNWAPLIERYMTQRHMPLVTSCGTCCGELFARHREMGQGRAGVPPDHPHPGEARTPVPMLPPVGQAGLAPDPPGAIRGGGSDPGFPDRSRGGGADGRPAHRPGREWAGDQIVGASSLPGWRRQSALRPVAALLAQAQAARGETKAASHTADRLSAIADIAGLDGVQAHATLARARSLRTIEAPSPPHQSTREETAETVDTPRS
ncbi:MAG: hypothetical protein ACRDWS_12315 [Acidimicrobiia bacterium]